MKQIIDRTPAMRAYFKQITNDNHNDNLNSRDRLVVENYRVAVYVASQYKGCGMEMEDLIGYANIGLVEAANRYNPSLGVEFAPYACRWCRREIMQGLTDAGLSIRLPIRRRMLVKRILDAQDAFFAANGREAVVSEIAEQLGADRQLVESLLLSTKRFSSLDEAYIEMEGITLGEAVADRDAEDAGEELDKKIRVENALAKFGPKQREVLCRYYLREQDIPTIAQEMRLTPVRIRQILAACTKEK